MNIDCSISKTDAARRLGISPQSLGYQIKHSTNSKIIVTSNGILVSSLMSEIQRRYKVIENALLAEQDECMCCRQKLGKNANRYIQGHDSILRSAMQTLFSSGSEIDKEVVLYILKKIDKTIDEFLYTQHISHLFPRE